MEAPTSGAVSAFYPSPVNITSDWHLKFVASYGCNLCYGEEAFGLLVSNTTSYVGAPGNGLGVVGGIGGAFGLVFLLNDNCFNDTTVVASSNYQFLYESMLINNGCSNNIQVEIFYAHTSGIFWASIPFLHLSIPIKTSLAVEDYVGNTAYFGIVAANGVTVNFTKFSVSTFTLFRMLLGGLPNS